MTIQNAHKAEKKLYQHLNACVFCGVNRRPDGWIDVSALCVRGQQVMAKFIELYSELDDDEEKEYEELVPNPVG